MNPNALCKKMTLVLALACISVAVYAGPITREQAQERAAQFLSKVPGSRRLVPVTKQAKLGPRRAGAARTWIYTMCSTVAKVKAT